MKKQLILAAISAAFIAAPFVDAAAASGFSSGPSKSSSNTSSSKQSSNASKPVSTSGSSSSTSSAKRDSGSSWGSSSATPKRDTSSGWGSTSAAPAPKRDYGASSWGSVTPSRKADTARPAATDYAPANRVTPQPKPVSGFNSAPPSAAVPVAAQPTVGFSDTKSSTKKKVAAVAGATALGGALYAAGANQEAVAAYQRSQEPADKPAELTEHTAATTTASKNDTRTTSPASVPSPAYPSHAQPQPQVIVVKERGYSRDDAIYDIEKSYRDGVRDAQRQARRTEQVINQEAYRQPGVQTVPHTTVTQPAGVAPAAKQSSGFGSVILWTLVILLVLGALAYFVMQVMTAGSPKTSARPAARKSNYTL